jgi:hypothetical protein
MATACTNLIGNLLFLGQFFLWVALLLAIVSSFIWVWDQIKGQPARIADAGGFLDSLKGLVEALAKAPPWFAVFVAGAMLIWGANALSKDKCNGYNPSARVEQKVK